MPATVQSPVEDYELVRLLQDAIFGHVYEAKGLRSQREFAIKVYDKSALAAAQEKSFLELCEVPLSEIKFAEEMRGHNNILEVQEFFEDRHCIYVVSSLCKGGDLLEALKQCPGGFEEAEGKCFIRQAVQGLAELHRRGVAMQDVSLENLLLHASAKNRHWEVKICDPGQAVHFDRDAAGEEIAQPVRGPVGKSFRPPEIYRETTYFPTKVDSWTLGWSVWYLLTATPLFTTADPRQMDTDWEKLSSGRLQELLSTKPLKISADGLGFIFSVLRIQPRARMSIEDALSHPWLLDPVPAVLHTVVFASCAGVTGKKACDICGRLTGQRTCCQTCGGAMFCKRCLVAYHDDKPGHAHQSADFPTSSSSGALAGTSSATMADALVPDVASSGSTSCVELPARKEEPTPAEEASEEEILKGVAAEQQRWEELAAQMDPEAPWSYPVLRCPKPPSSSPACGSIPADVYIGGLHPDVTEEKLEEVFGCVGVAARATVCRDVLTKRSLGYGFVDVPKPSDAEHVVDTLNYSFIKGHPCHMMLSKHLETCKDGAGLIAVHGLDPKLGSKEVSEAFKLFGRVVLCKVVTDFKEQSLGFGFVHYEHRESAEQAVKQMNGKLVGLRNVQVCKLSDLTDSSVPRVGSLIDLYMACFPQGWDPKLQVFQSLDSEILQPRILTLSAGQETVEKLELTCMTLQGNVVARVHWPNSLPVTGLPAAVVAAVEASGFRGLSELRTWNLHLLKQGSDPCPLELESTAPLLSAQLGL